MLCQHQEKGEEKDKQDGLKKREERGKKRCIFLNIPTKKKKKRKERKG